MSRLLPREIADAISESTQSSDRGWSGAEVPLAIRLRRQAWVDLKDCGEKRAEIAWRLSGMLGRDISLAQLDAVVSETKTQYRFPAEWIPAWVKATGSQKLLEIVAAESGLLIATQEDLEFAEWARREFRQREVESALRSKVWATKR